MKKGNIYEGVVKKVDFPNKAYVEVIETDENGNELAAVVKSGNNKLLNVLNKSIAILRNNGKLDELNEKWFPVEETTRGEE